MTPPPIPPREPGEDAVQGDALERALFGQELLPAPPDLAARVVGSLEPRGRRVLSLQAIARLAAAVLLALGTWVATLGGLPTLAHAEPPSLVESVLAPTREILPEAPVDLAALGLEDAAVPPEELPVAALAGVGALLLAAGLLLARSSAKEKTS